MTTVFYALVAVLLVGAGAYWWFFMKGKGGDKKKVDMTEGATTQETADMGGEKTSAEPEKPVESAQNEGDAQDENKVS